MFSALKIWIVCAYVAATARALLDAPAVVSYVSAGAGALWFGGLWVRAEMRSRRARRGWKMPAEPDEVAWVDCDQRREAAGLVWKCSNRKGHDGPHEASPSVEW